jgi:hypothetical protein
MLVDSRRTTLLAPLLLLLPACPGNSGDSSGSATGTGTSGTSVGATDVSTSSASGPPTTSVTSDSTAGSASSTATTTATAGTTQGTDTAASSSTGADTTGAIGSTSSSGTTDIGGSSTGEPPPPPSDIDVVITADNAYSFAYGTEDSVAKFFGGVEAVTAGQIFNCGEGPEKYTVPAADAANATYLYIMAWDDSAVTNGVIARFRRTDGGMGFGDEVFTGTPGWEVCATGLKYEIGQGGPTLAVINDHLTKCNAGALDPNTSSGGWVDEVGTAIGAVAFGEDNTTPYDGGPKAGNEFPLVCPMDMPAQARWMWFNWDPANVKPPQSPFIFPGGANPYHQFLIFRFAAELIPIPQ